MNMTLFRRSFKKRRRSLAWCAVGMLLLAIMYTALYPSIKDVYSQMDQFPEDILKAFGLEGIGDLGTASGYLQVELFSFMGPIVVIAFGAVLGVGAIASSERSGEMELLLANPISRTTVVVQRFLAMLAFIVLLSGVLWFGLVVGTPFDVWPGLNQWNLIEAVLSLIFLGWAFGSLALALSAITGSSGLSYAIVVAIALTTFILNSFSQIIPDLEGMKWVSPFYYYTGSNPLTDGLNWWHALVPLGITVTAFAISLFAFNRRDLKSPD
jgi:ABC-2 type transport system permease protein